MLSCKDISHLASDHIDKNLPFLTRVKIRIHLFMCHDCRNFMKQFHTSVKAMAGMKIPKIDQESIDLQAEKLIQTAQHIRTENIDR